MTVEVKSERQFAANELLCGVEFTVHDVMGTARDNDDPSFKLRGEKAAGVLHATFEFDPPVPCDVVSGAAQAGALVEDPVYLDVEDGCACIMLARRSGVRDGAEASEPSPPRTHRRIAASAFDRALVPDVALCVEVKLKKRMHRAPTPT